MGEDGLWAGDKTTVLTRLKKQEQKDGKTRQQEVAHRRRPSRLPCSLKSLLEGREGPTQLSLSRSKEEWARGQPV
ncbi:hypothetical protein DAI22_07g123800 [Oryza sativa Japonica Group]|nr:hypothetical protein DAI22_07g123800 [Oryza sativa Japonica Group]